VALRLPVDRVDRLRARYQRELEFGRDAGALRHARERIAQPVVAGRVVVTRFQQRPGDLVVEAEGGKGAVDRGQLRRVAAAEIDAHVFPASGDAALAAGQIADYVGPPAGDGPEATTCRGRSTVNTQPTPGMLRTLRTPPMASTLRLQIDKPRPRPDLSVLPCVNGSNILSASPGGRPPQLSSTSIMTRSPAAWARSETSVFSSVNLKAFCRRLPTAESSRSRSASTARLGSTVATASPQPRDCASSDAEILTSPMKPASGISWRRTGIPAVTRTSASERSTRLRRPIRLRSSTAPVAPASPTLPALIAVTASVAFWIRLRSSCAKKPSRSLSASTPASASRRSRW